MTHYTCDRCKKEVILENMAKLNAHVNSTVMGWYEANRDLCLDCWHVIRMNIDTYKENKDAGVGTSNASGDTGTVPIKRVPYYD